MKQHSSNISRRTFIQSMSLSAGALMTPGLAGSVFASEPNGKPKPNVILCMADDHGWGDVGYNGHKNLKTPHLDLMAQDGLRCDRFYSGAPVCSPTRGNCITGRHPTRYGIPWANTGKMLDEEITLGEALQAQGYRTGHFGKWHLGTLTKTVKDGNRGGRGEAHYAPPWEHGFDTCFSTESKVPTYWKEYPGNYGTRYWTGEKKPVEGPYKGDDSAMLMTPALSFIDDAVKQDKPFLAVIWFHSPHLPIVMDPEFADTYKDLDPKVAAYYSSISAIDKQMGRLRSHLKKLGIENNTLLTYTSDNGPERKTPGTTGGLRARKRSLYEGGIRVPGLFVWPGRIKPAVTAMPCGTMDYFPTALDLVGAWKEEFRRPIDGLSLTPLFNEKMKTRDKPIGFSSPNSKPNTALIDDRFKLVGTDELYDIPADRAEAKNVAADHPEVLKKMQTTMNEFLKSCQSSRKGHDYKG